MQTISATQAPELLIDIMKAGLVPMLTSSPGIGKSSIAKAVAKSLDLKVIDLRLSQCDPSDLLGFPSINVERTKAGYVPMDTFPILGDDLPIKLDADGKELFTMASNPNYGKRSGDGVNTTDKEIKVFTRFKGWLLFLDEMNSAAKSVQAAAYKIVLDKQVGIFELHPNVLMMAAGNLATDNAVVNKLGTAMQSRMVHLQLREDFKAFMAWAATSGMDYRVTSFLQFKPGALFMFKPDHAECTFPCPRTWEFVSKIIKPWKTIEHKKAAIIDGTVGEGTGREFLAFCQVFNDLPTIQGILANPADIPISKEPTVRYALTGMISTHITKANSEDLMIFINRLPVEFQIITLQAALLRDQTLMADGSAFQKWVMENASRLMS